MNQDFRTPHPHPSHQKDKGPWQHMHLTNDAAGREQGWKAPVSSFLMRTYYTCSGWGLLLPLIHWGWRALVCSSRSSPGTTSPPAVTRGLAGGAAHLCKASEAVSCPTKHTV